MPKAFSVKIKSKRFVAEGICLVEDAKTAETIIRERLKRAIMKWLNINRSAADEMISENLVVTIDELKDTVIQFNWNISAVEVDTSVIPHVV
jgi:hypothetical protein